MTPSAPRSSIAICLLGMHRAGTSALARLINLLGVDFSADLVSPRRGNPTGFWEHRKIVDIHEQLLDALHSSFDDFLPLENDWLKTPAAETARAQLLELVRHDFSNSLLWGFKDPRACRLLPLWSEIFQATNADDRYLLSLRDPGEIAKSLALRDGISLNHALLTTLAHLLDAEAQTRSKPRAIVRFDQLLSDWRKTMEQIGRELSIDWPKTFSQIQRDVEDFLDPALRHHQSAVSLEESLPGADKEILAWISKAHAALTSTPINTPALDQVASEFNHAKPRLAAWRNGLSLYYKVAKLEDWTQTLNREKAALAARLAAAQTHAAELENYCEELKSSADSDRLRVQQERQQLDDEWDRHRRSMDG